jgi:hypothetical protein
MEGRPPPYRPFRGALPPHFVDRSTDDLAIPGIVEASFAAFANGPADPRFHRLVIAGAGMGKTALLRFVSQEAEARLGWVSTFHRCGPKKSAIAVLPALVSASLKRCRPALAPLLRSSADSSFWGQLHNLVRQCARSSQLNVPGLFIALDDADLLGAGEVESLGYLAQSLAREDLKVAIWMSVRPWLARRFERGGHLPSSLWVTALSPLEDTEAREAIVVPAADRGVEFEGRALKIACAAASGSPLELQKVGFASWAAAGGRQTVRVGHVRQALAGEGSWPRKRRAPRRGRLLELRANIPTSLPA